MAKQERTRRALQDEASRRIQKIDEIAEEGARILVPAPEPHPRDARGRNWNIERFGHAAGYERRIRPLVDEMRDEYDLVDGPAGLVNVADPFAPSDKADGVGPKKPVDPFGPAS
jgi:hypothetical protein